jgi:hypothetical protein
MNVVRGGWRSCCRFFKEMEAVAMTVEKLSKKLALLRQSRRGEKRVAYAPPRQKN